MAIKIGDLFFDVYADVSRAAKSVDDLSGKFAAAGSTAARAIGETIANATAIATAGILALGAATLSAGAAYNTLGQSATAAFSSIFDDVSAAHSILSDISELDLTTPFKGTALTATARTLAGFGFQLQDVTATTEALAQATAAMGLGSDALHRMAIAFGQIQSRGKLAGDEARQLANYGIDAYGLLAEKLNLSVAATRELGQQGKLTSDFVIPALIDSINTRFAGATEALFNTAAGQAEGLRSILEGVGSALVEPFIGFTGGGALVEGMAALREELIGLVSVASDGSFVLEGFLAPLTPLAQAAADAVGDLSRNLAGFLGGLDESTLPQLFSQLEGMGPLLAGAGAALLTVFAQSIPFLGRFVAGFNPIVVGVTALILASDQLRGEFTDAFREIYDIIRPLIPQVQELLRTIVDLAEDAGPAVADILVNAFRALAPVVSDLLSVANDLIPVLGPVLIEVLEEVAAALEAIAMLLENDTLRTLALLGTAVYGLTVAFPIATAGIVANTAAIGLSGGAAALAATQWGMLATAIAGAYAAYLAWAPVIAGAGSQEGAEAFLTKDANLLEQPFQDLARIAFGAGGGNLELVEAMQEYDRVSAIATQTALDFAHSQEAGAMSVAEFRERAEEAGFTYGILATAVAEYARMNDELIAGHMEEAAALGGATAAANLFEARVAAMGRATADATEETEEAVDVLKELEAAATAAWGEVDRLLRPSRDVTIDDFLRSLLPLAQDVTDALAMDPGILRDLDLSGAQEAVRQQARDLISTMAREFGVGLDEVYDMLNERGLAGVIDALGRVTEETTETVDPLIAKYSSLGATADQLRDAIARLNDERQTGLRAQIDQVQAALEDAKEAAQEAREAVSDFLSGGYLGSAQQAADELVSNIGNIGSAIEDALRQGGVRGEAALRLALGDLQSGVLDVVNAGIEEGLNANQIIDLLAPILGAINEEVGQGLNRISSLDFSEGITGAAGQELASVLSGLLDPRALQQVMNAIFGADANVAGLESQLENLQGQLNVEVEFSPAQVQGALDAIEQTQITTTPVVTPEAAQLVWDAIQEIFDDPTNELDTAVDKAIITQQILDAAKEAEDSINLVFASGLSFDTLALHEVARAVSDEFYAAFNQNLQELKDQRAQEWGFADYGAMIRALGPSVAAATIGAVNVQIEAPIEVTATGLPPETEITATQRVAANSAAAGSGGSVNTLLSRYGTSVIPGYRGPQ